MWDAAAALIVVLDGSNVTPTREANSPTIIKSWLLCSPMSCFTPRTDIYPAEKIFTVADDATSSSSTTSQMNRIRKVQAINRNPALHNVDSRLHRALTQFAAGFLRPIRRVRRKHGVRRLHDGMVEVEGLLLLEHVQARAPQLILQSAWANATVSTTAPRAVFTSTASASWRPDVRR